MPVVSVSQASIRVDVAFYDDADREALLKYPTAEKLRQLVAEPIEVPTSEFLSYYLFHRKRLGKDGYRDYHSIGQKLGIAIHSLEDCIDFNGHSIVRSAGVVQQLNEVTEHAGEGIGLSVMSKIHDLSEADWAPIKEQRGRGAAPTFDFELASDGENFVQVENEVVQVENKGSSVVDNRVLDPAVRAQKRKIAEKKLKLKVLSKKGTDPHPASLRYGTITAIDDRRDGNVRCWLTDPPPEIDDDPRRFRLMQRMRFLRDCISFISRTSHLAVALSTRLADMEAMRDPFELDGVPLPRGDGEPLDLSPYNPGEYSRFFSNKSNITEGPAGGVIVQISGRALFLIGIREDLPMMAAQQDFDRVLEYRALAGSIEKTVECVLSESRARTMSLPSSVLERARRSAGNLFFRLDGLIHYSPAGLVFGLLPLPVE
jgi:hypothetical protein